MNTTVLTAALLTALGLFLRYRIGRRRFNRRGLGGLQHFTTYGKTIWVTGFETLINFLGLLCLLAGLLLFALTGFNAHFKF
jgi:hypothetical protein